MEIKPSVFVCLPAYGYNVSAFTTVSLFNLSAVLNKYGIGVGIGTMSYPDIAEARNSFLTWWYDKQPTFTHCLFVDADMQFKPELVLDMLAIDKPVVGCFYRKRTEDTLWVGEPLFENQQVKDGFMRVHGIGFGVALLGRKCVDLLMEKYPQQIALVKEGDIDAVNKAFQLDRVFRFFDRIPTGKFNALSEDYSFCKRYREAGGDIWATVGHNIGHIGAKTYEGVFWDYIQQLQSADE